MSGAKSTNKTSLNSSGIYIESSTPMDNAGKYTLISIVSSFIIAAMISSFFMSDRMINKYAPLVDAAMEIKLEATTAHLWFEEIISGDRHENIEAITAHIDQALWYAQAMLEGGKIQRAHSDHLKTLG